MRSHRLDYRHQVSFCESTLYDLILGSVLETIGGFLSRRNWDACRDMNKYLVF
jgi:hypothetical protein